MIPRLRVRPAARTDVISARDWYESQRPGLGDEFADEVVRLLNRIQDTPEIYAGGYSNVRRAKVARFPYVVYYRIESDAIEVLAILRGHRDPRTWHGRA